MIGHRIDIEDVVVGPSWQLELLIFLTVATTLVTDDAVLDEPLILVYLEALG